MANLVVVARFASRPEALIAQARLRAEGIETFMPDFNVLMADFDPSFMESGWRLMGIKQDAAAAHAILTAVQNEPDAD